MVAMSLLEGVKPLVIGPHRVDTPVVLAPMAGVTNAAFRRLCREFGAGFYVSQLVLANALLRRNEESMRLISFDADEHPRSLQLYGVDPETLGAAVRMVADEDRADHIDLNFGCPVSKVTRKGGGAALPWKLDLFREIVRAAVRNASPSGIPVTVKMRIGIDDEHRTYLDAARIAEAEGVAAVALHARTAAQNYSGQADWSAIARLKEAITSIPVLGNGDIWTAEDALEMMHTTGCDGVVVGRGCLGRPWLFADLQAALSGDPARVKPGMDVVVATMARHARLLVEHFEDERGGCIDFRKHVAWYLKGYPVGREIRNALVQVGTLEELHRILDTIDTSIPYPGEAAEGQRGKQGTPKRVSLPEGWLADRCVDTGTFEDMRANEEHCSGG